MPAPVKKNLNKVPNQEPNTTGAKPIEKKPPPVKTDSLDILSELDGPVIVQSVSQPHVSAAPSNQNVNAFGSSNASGTVSQENSKSNDFFAELNGAYNVQLPNKQGSSPPPTFQPQLFDIIPSQPKQPSQAPINLKYGFNNRPGTPNAQARGGTGYFGQNVRDVFK
uniref:Uncharacterized protein n=1 Tax=Coptotermes formosanus TaxID=36987 RepID=R4UX71_COPFO|nr:hypothetical protein [Coptotermes formosanus]